MKIFKKSLVPEIADVNPEHETALQKMTALGQNGAVLRNRKALLCNLIKEGKTNQGLAPTRDQIETATRIAVVLGEEPPPENFATTEDELRYIDGQLADIDHAMRVLRDRIEKEKRKTGAALREATDADHRRLVAAMSTKLLELYDASAAYTDYADAMADHDITLTSEIPSFMVGRECSAAYWLREMAQHNLIKKIDIPEGWQ